MALYMNDGVEYMVDDYFQHKHGENCEEEDDSHEKNGTSAAAYRNGKDIQGIPWERLNHSREKYREMRLKQYKNYENFPRSKNESGNDCQMVETGHTFYDFQFNTRLVKSTIVHFQILISCVAKSSGVLNQLLTVGHFCIRKQGGTSL